MVEPVVVLRESIKAIPAVKYALGIAGIVSVIAIVKSFNIDFRVAVVGTIVMLLFMVLLVIFAKVAKLASPDFRLPALVFTWFALFFLIAIAVLMFCSAFFNWPVNPMVLVDNKPLPNFEYKKESESGVDSIGAGLLGKDTGNTNSPSFNETCPEIPFTDYSKNPAVTQKIRMCD